MLFFNVILDTGYLLHRAVHGEVSLCLVISGVWTGLVDGHHRASFQLQKQKSKKKESLSNKNSNKRHQC